MILALETPEVTTHRSEGEGGRPRKEVKDGLFFNRIHVEGDGSAKDEGVELSVPVLPDAAESSFKRRYDASVITEIALDLSSFQRLVKHGFFHTLLRFLHGRMHPHW